MNPFDHLREVADEVSPMTERESELLAALKRAERALVVAHHHARGEKEKFFDGELRAARAAIGEGH